VPTSARETTTTDLQLLRGKVAEGKADNLSPLLAVCVNKVERFRWLWGAEGIEPPTSCL
jgi:hypothetical protein